MRISRQPGRMGRFMAARRLVRRVERGDLTTEAAAEILWQSYAGDGAAARVDAALLRDRFGSNLSPAALAVLDQAERLAARGDRNDAAP